MKSKYNTDDIARYAEGLMEADELAAFEAALSQDAELQEQLILYKEAHSKLEKHFQSEEGEEKLKRTLQDMRTEFFSGQRGSAPVKNIAPYRTKVVNAMWRKLAIVAAAAILVAVFVWKPWQGEDLVTKYAATQMINPVERGSHADSVLALASNSFNAKEYAVAATYLAELVNADSTKTNSFARFYYGVSLLLSGKTEMSREPLSMLAEGSSAFKYEAMYHLALSYLQAKDRENCRKWLEKIPEGSDSYEKALKLLKDL